MPQEKHARGNAAYKAQPGVWLRGPENVPDVTRGSCEKGGGGLGPIRGIREGNVRRDRRWLGPG